MPLRSKGKLIIRFSPRVAILKSVVKSAFSICPTTVSENVFHLKMFFLGQIFLGTGGDENLIINFLWPKVGIHFFQEF